MSLRLIKRMAIKEFKLIPVDEVLITTKLSEILERISRRPNYMAVVKSKRGKRIQGIITKSSIFKFLGEQKTADLKAIDAVRVLIRNFVFVEESDTIDKVRKKLLDNNLNEIMIFDEEMHVKGSIARDSFACQVREKVSTR